MRGWGDCGCPVRSKGAHPRGEGRPGETPGRQATGAGNEAASCEQARHARASAACASSPAPRRRTAPSDDACDVAGPLAPHTRATRACWQPASTRGAALGLMCRCLLTHLCCYAALRYTVAASTRPRAAPWRPYSAVQGRTCVFGRTKARGRQSLTHAGPSRLVQSVTSSLSCSRLLPCCLCSVVAVCGLRLQH